MSEIVKIGKKAQIVIPKKIRNKLNLKEGGKVFIDIIGDMIVIMPAPRNIEDLAGMGKGLYGKDYLERLRDEWK